MSRGDDAGEIQLASLPFSMAALRRVYMLQGKKSMRSLSVPPLRFLNEKSFRTKAEQRERKEKAALQTAAL